MEKALQPAIERHSAKAVARLRRPESDLVLIDVGLLLDARIPGALLLIRFELLVPPQGPAFFLLLDDVRLVPKQIADHPGEVGFVGFRHGPVRAKLYAPCQAD